VKFSFIAKHQGVWPRDGCAGRSVSRGGLLCLAHAGAWHGPLRAQTPREPFSKVGAGRLLTAVPGDLGYPIPRPLQQKGYAGAQRKTKRRAWGV